MFEAGYRKEAERRRNAQLDYMARLAKVGIAPIDEESYGSRWPHTVRGWELHRRLLVAEGKLTEQAAREIDDGIADARLRDLQIDIRKELEAGGAIRHPIDASLSPISDTECLRYAGNELVSWEAVRRLGLTQDQRFKHFQDSANKALQLWECKSFDRMAFWESIHPAPKPSQPGTQQLAIPRGFVEVEITLPMSAFENPPRKLTNIRYHPKFGLVAGSISKRRYFDRGAGGFMAGRGAFVTDYMPEINLFTPQLIVRNVKPKVRRVSVWLVIADSNVVIGRQRANQTVEAALYYKEKFSTEKEVKKYLSGEIESRFLMDTLPVTVSRRSKEFQLRFWARQIVTQQST